MRALVQRVLSACVQVGEETVGEVAEGLLVLVCAMRGDPDDAPQRLARKIAAMRIFRDDAGKMNRSIADTGGAALVVSQFTLAADTRSGNRPGFSTAEAPDRAERLYLAFADALRADGVPVETGRFGAEMRVALVNDGPVTVWIDEAETRKPPQQPEA